MLSTIITAEQLAAAWTQLWNGSFDIADQLCAKDFRVFFGNAIEADGHPGDAVHTPAEFADYLRKFHADRPGVRFEVAAPTTGTVEPDGTSRVSLVWHVTMPDGATLSGIDLLETIDTKVSRAWSVAGRRRLPTT
ncbi:nuclear transport factor 2 family protein [Nocardia niigatensis]